MRWLTVPVLERPWDIEDTRRLPRPSSRAQLRCTHVAHAAAVSAPHGAGLLVASWWASWGPYPAPTPYSTLGSFILERYGALSVRHTARHDQLELRASSRTGFERHFQRSFRGVRCQRAGAAARRGADRLHLCWSRGSSGRFDSRRGRDAAHRSRLGSDDGRIQPGRIDPKGRWKRARPIRARASLPAITHARLGQRR